MKWSAFALVTGRKPSVDLHTDAYFAIADRDDLDYDEKLARYSALADQHFDTERYFDWCDSRLSHFDEVALEWFRSPGLDRVIVDTVREMFPAHEHDQFIAHYRGLLAAWCADEEHRLSSGEGATS